LEIYPLAVSRGFGGPVNLPQARGLYDRVLDVETVVVVYRDAFRVVGRDRRVAQRDHRSRCDTGQVLTAEAAHEAPRPRCAMVQRVCRVVELLDARVFVVPDIEKRVEIGVVVSVRADD